MEDSSWKNAWKGVTGKSRRTKKDMAGIRRKPSIDRHGSALSDRVGLNRNPDGKITQNAWKRLGRIWELENEGHREVAQNQNLDDKLGDIKTFPTTPLWFVGPCRTPDFSMEAGTRRNGKIRYSSKFAATQFVHCLLVKYQTVKVIYYFYTLSNIISSIGTCPDMQIIKQEVTVFRAISTCLACLSYCNRI